LTRAVAALAVGVVVAFAASMLGAGTAFAHNVLVHSDPANGATLSNGPARVTLTFDLPVQNVYSAVSVVGPDKLHYEAAASQVNGNSISADVSPLGPAGVYTVGYRIVSEDGHPVGGSITFTLSTAGGGRGVPAQQSPAAAQQAADPGTSSGSGEVEGAGGSGGAPVWPWIVGAALLVAAGVVVALRVGRNADEE
jgi:methionine-rich copper-binding protein CopC